MQNKRHVLIISYAIYRNIQRTHNTVIVDTSKHCICSWGFFGQRLCRISTEEPGTGPGTKKWSRSSDTKRQYQHMPKAHTDLILTSPGSAGLLLWLVSGNCRDLWHYSVQWFRFARVSQSASRWLTLCISSWNLVAHFDAITTGTRRFAHSLC